MAHSCDCRNWEQQSAQRSAKRKRSFGIYSSPLFKAPHRSEPDGHTCWKILQLTWLCLHCTAVVLKLIWAGSCGYSVVFRAQPRELVHRLQTFGRVQLLTFFESDAADFAVIVALSAAELKHVDRHGGPDLLLSQAHAIVEHLEEPLRLLLLVQLVVEGDLRERLEQSLTCDGYSQINQAHASTFTNSTKRLVLTCICVFPPWRRAMPSRMLSSNTRSFLVLTMRSITSSEAPTLSKRHWISTTVLTGLSESNMGELPAKIRRNMTDGTFSLMETNAEAALNSLFSPWGAERCHVICGCFLYAK